MKAELGAERTLARAAAKAEAATAYAPFEGNPVLRSPSDLMGVEKASPELISAMEKHGRTIRIAQPNSQELRYLDYMGAEANVGGENMSHILLRNEPSKGALLEEYLHGTQHKLGIIEKSGQQAAEVHVKDFMVRHQKMLGLGEQDVEILKTLREREQVLLERQLAK